MAGGTWKRYRKKNGRFAKKGSTRKVERASRYGFPTVRKGLRRKK